LLHAAMVSSSSTNNATQLFGAGAGYLLLLWPGIIVVNQLERRRRPIGNIPPRGPSRIFPRR
jgi:hypothetical protein